jgi:hypothetical protein
LIKSTCDRLFLTTSNIMMCPFCQYCQYNATHGCMHMAHSRPGTIDNLVLPPSAEYRVRSSLPRVSRYMSEYEGTTDTGKAEQNYDYANYCLAYWPYPTQYEQCNNTHAPNTSMTRMTRRTLLMSGKIEQSVYWEID